MDLRIQTSLIAAMLSVALGISVLLRPRKRREHWVFSTFAINLGLWYAATAARWVFGGELWDRLHLLAGVLVPLAALQFFRTFAPEEDRRMAQLARFGWIGATMIVSTILTPYYENAVVGTLLLLYVGAMLAIPLALLFRRGKSAASRFEGARLRYLAVFGGLGGFFTLLEYLPAFGLDIPPVGTLLVLVFLYLLSQSLVHYRLIDLYELAGRLAVLLALSFMLATMLWGMHTITGDRYFVHGVASAMVVLLLFDPVRSKVTDRIAQFFFRERYEFEMAIANLRRRTAHTLELRALCEILMDGLDRSRRVTQAAIYLADPDGRGYHCAGAVGSEAVARVEMAPARPLLDRITREGAVTLEATERELEESRESGENRDAETAFDIVQTLEALGASVCLAIRGDDGDLYGFLTLRDDRMRDAFSPEEVQLLEGLATQAAVTVENSRLYQQMKERDRLAALGEMAAGLAHEIRNPLGSIKASAQYLTEPGHEGDEGASEFLDIIVDEVDRLNRVVGGFLDYARPGASDATPTDVNAVLGRTIQLLKPECEGLGVTVAFDADPTLPEVRIDPEKLRQVIINLIQNAAQAMGPGEVRVSTLHRTRAGREGPRPWVQIRVADQGPGIPDDVRQKLFVPFFTTKERGTGLGLAISQRIVTAAGGLIAVRSQVGVGSTFVVHFPGVTRGTASESGVTSTETAISVA